MVDYELQRRLLMELAEELMNQPLTKKEAIASLNRAGILTKKGKFTKNYPALREYNEKLKQEKKLR